MKKHNFNAGPSILADEVIENAAKAVLDFNGSGLSVLSISHRSKEFDAVMEEADRLFRELLAIPDNYRIVYLGGGASTLFYEVAANFLGRKAGYGKKRPAWLHAVRGADAQKGQAVGERASHGP